MTAPPAQTLVGWLSSVATAQASRPALYGESNKEITYAELWSRAGGIARLLLQDKAIPPASRVAIVGANEPAYIETFLGILRAGHVAVPLNPMLDVPSIQAQLDLVEASAVILGDVSSDLDEGLREGRHCLELTAIRRDASPLDDRTKLPRLLPGMPASIIPTSGSTGAPRGVLHTQATLLHCALQIANAMPMRPDDRNVAFLPFFASIPEQVLPTLCTGGSIEVLPRFDVERVAEACRRATCFDAVPTIMARLLDEAPLDALANLRWVYFASEPMPPALLRRWHEALPGVEAHQFYGMTELVPATAASHRMLLEDPTTVGIAFPTTQVTQDDTGQLLLRSPSMMRGYYNDPAATKAALTATGAIKTGDLGRIDERGRVYLTGRLKDIIITGGLNVAPAEIEAIACHHPGVGAAAVVGIPDPRWGETPVVVGVARDGNGGLTADSLLQHCRQGLKGFKRPSAAAVVESLPSTGIGKIAKNLLRDQIVRGEIALVRAE